MLSSGATLSELKQWLFLFFSARLPWEITAVMLADSFEKYRERERRLISDFNKHFGLGLNHVIDELDMGVVQWVERHQPRK